MYIIVENKRVPQRSMRTWTRVAIVMMNSLAAALGASQDKGEGNKGKPRKQGTPARTGNSHGIPAQLLDRAHRMARPAPLTWHKSADRRLPPLQTPWPYPRQQRPHLISKTWHSICSELLLRALTQPPVLAHALMLTPDRARLPAQPMPDQAAGGPSPRPRRCQIWRWQTPRCSRKSGASHRASAMQFYASCR